MDQFKPVQNCSVLVIFFCWLFYRYSLNIAWTDTSNSLIAKKNCVRDSSYYHIFQVNHQWICSSTYLQLYSSATILGMEKIPSITLKKIALHFKLGNLSAFHLTYRLWKATVVKNKSLDTYHIEGLYDVSLSMEPGLIYFAPKEKKLKQK